MFKVQGGGRTLNFEPGTFNSYLYGSNIRIISTMSNETDLLKHTRHRPWPLPSRRWVMAMRWHRLLFLHWPVRPETIRPLIPAELELDTYDGFAWIGVVPFSMSGVRPRYVPPCAGLAFLEMNVRTYAKSPGRNGVWFFSLDAQNRLAVRLARIWYGLPYYDAQMEARLQGEAVHYRSIRANSPEVEFDAVYEPRGTVYRSAPGTLDHWLTERYCLYALDRRGTLRYLDIHHLPWPLQPAEVSLHKNTMVTPLGIRGFDRSPEAHFAAYLEVVGWPSETLG
jgi:uncharacterized protein